MKARNGFLAVRRRALVFCVAFATGVAVATLAFAKQAVVVNRPVPSDVILVPSGDFALRSERALEFARKVWVNRF